MTPKTRTTQMAPLESPAFKAFPQFDARGLEAIAKSRTSVDPSSAHRHILNAASTRYRVAIGPGAGGRTLTLQNRGLQR